MIYFSKLVLRYLQYRKSQYWSRERIDAYHDTMLRRLIIHAGKHVPYYRELFAKINLKPEEFRGRVDMPKIPLLDKEIVRTRREDLTADNAERYGIHWDSTSGSTGTPLHMIIDNDTNINKLTALIRSYQWAGYTFGKKTFSLQSYYIKDAEIKFNPFFNVLRFDSNHLKKDSALRVVERINRIKPKFFMGFPFDLLILSRFAEKAGIDISRPDSIVTYGETLSDKKRELLESGYKCPVFDYYSHHECVAMIAECEHHKRHLVEDFAYHEIVDEQGDDAWDKGGGELIGTGLYNYAMPLIRYKTRDTVTTDAEPKTCACGRHFRNIEKILGKQCDYLETVDGRLLGAVMSHSADNAKGVVMSQCVQDAKDHITIRMITDAAFDDASLAAFEAGLRKRLGDKMKIDFQKADQLEKSRGGKTPFILSKIGNEYI